MNNPVQPAPVAPRTSGLAIASLVMGVLGMSVPAIITGHMARARIKKDPGLTGAGLALAGLILGYLTLVACIVLIIAAVVISNGIAAAAREQAANAKMMVISAKLETYRMVAGDYPTEAQGLRALVEQPDTPPIPRRWKQQFQTVPVDPWGSEFGLRRNPPGSYEIISPGKDGRLGTDDDLSSKTSP